MLDKFKIVSLEGRGKEEMEWKAPFSSKKIN